MLSTILSSASAVIVVILLLGLSIFVHEAGHFIAARLCGLVVDVFSIGFGPALWKRKRGNTTYKLGAIPFGGYVALPQLDPTGMALVQGEETDEQQKGKDAKAAKETPEPRELPPIAAWKKIIVSVAGVTGNVILAILLAVLVWLIGMPADPSEKSTQVGTVKATTEAYEKGLRMGDRITKVNGRIVENWRDVKLAVALDTVATVDAVSPEGEPKHLVLKTERANLGGRVLPGVGGLGLCQVLKTIEGSPAERAGLKRDDIIMVFDDQKLLSPDHLVSLVGAREGKTVPVVVKRWVRGEPSLLTMDITPVARAPKPGEVPGTRPSVWIGIVFNHQAVDPEIIIHPRPGEQIKFHSSAIFRFLAALTRPEQAKVAADAVGGPVSILTVAWYTVRTSIMLAVWFMGFLNMNLAIINLLPIPVLDGGHIMFSLYEMIRRKPLHPRVVNGLVNIFAILLISLIILLSLRDVKRWFFPPRTKEATEDVQPAVSNAVPAAEAPAVQGP
jgi:regulator of sigma E protease